MLQSFLLLPSSPTLLHNPFTSPVFLLQKPTFFSTLSAHSNVQFRPLLAAREPLSTDTEEAVEEEEEGNGPIELPPSYSSFSSSSPLQTATTVLLSGAIAVFLFRSIRRRAKRAKELRLRSSGMNKSLKEKSLNQLKAMGSAPIKTKKSKSTPFDALLGSLIAGVIAVFLYKFTTTIEAALNHQTISDNFSVRQLTITIRTIVNGLCYLATFVYGFNSLGLFLYSGQLALTPITEPSMINENETKGEENVSSLSSVKQNAVEGTEFSNRRENEDRNPGVKQWRKTSTIKIWRKSFQVLRAMASTTSEMKKSSQWLRATASTTSEMEKSFGRRQVSSINPLYKPPRLLSTSTLLLLKTVRTPTLMKTILGRVLLGSFRSYRRRIDSGFLDEEV